MKIWSPKKHSLDKAEFETSSSIPSGQIMSSFKMAYEIIPDDLITHVDGTPAICAARNPDPAVLEALLTHYREKTTNLHRLLSAIYHPTQMPLSVTRRKYLIFFVLQARVRLFEWET